jgi:hypothetical protein
MAMFRPVDTTGDALQNIIPLLVQKKRDQEELAYKDKVLQIKRDELTAEAEERAQKLKDEATKTRIKYLTDMYKSGVEKGDKNLASQFGTQLLGEGLPVAANILPPPPLANMGIDPMAEASPDMRPRLDFLVAQQNEWGEPYKDENGNLVQKNLKTGRVETASRAQTEKGSSLKKLIEERDALPEGHPGRSLYDQAITKAISSKGMIVESDGKGGFSIRTNVDANSPGNMQKTTTGKVEEKLLSANEGLARISGIVRSFKPEFQEIPTRLGTAWSSLKSKMGVGIPPEEQKRLEEYGVYKQDALENINLYIKEITGAQMSEKEAERLRPAMPDPGEGVFGGDDPVTFKSKLANTYKKLRMAQIRYNHYLSRGLKEDAFKELVKKGDVVSLERMEQILDEKGDQYAADLKKQNPNINTADLFDQVRSRLSKEFGLEF